MSDQYIEKIFLYFVAFSLLAHVVVFALIAFLPSKKPALKQEPYMIELEDLPQQKERQGKVPRERRRLAERSVRTPKESAPKGEMRRERIASIPRVAKRSPVEQFARPKEGGVLERGIKHEGQKEAVTRAVPGRDLLKSRKENLPGLAQLYPSANKLARLEESYRKKYGPEVEEGETKFLNTDDIQFGSFLRRFETAVYGVWRYPAEAARLGIEGVTPVKITFNRKGEIEHVQLLDSSGSKILDNEVFRTLRQIGPIGSFPRGYEKESFNLIAFFQYGIIRGMSRGMLH